MVNRNKAAQLGAVTTHRLNIHDTYGIAWSDEMIARDIMQNFFDSVPAKEFKDAVKIKTSRSSGRVEITSPVIFDIELLWRIGVGTKSANPELYAGGFGEGFVMAVLQILRNYSGAAVGVEVGAVHAEFRLEEISVTGVTARELICDVKEIESRETSRFVLTGAPSSLVKIFEDSYSFFFYPDNPLLGDCIGTHALHDHRSNVEPTIALYRSTKRKLGAIYYRRQLRAHLNIPFVICYNAQHKSVNTGRDRLNLNKKEVQYLLDACAKTLDEETIRTLVLTDLKPFWKSGHPFLSALSRAWKALPGYPVMNFPDTHCARAKDYSVSRAAKALGKTLCIKYMSIFGMPTDAYVEEAERIGLIRTPTVRSVADLLSILDSEQQDSDDAPPAIFDEGLAFRILTDAYETVMRKSLRSFAFLVFDPSPAVPELEDFHRERTICLARPLLEGSFADAFAEFTYQADSGYRAGYEGTFTDLLTERLDTAVTHRKELSAYNTQWLENQSPNDHFKGPQFYAVAISQIKAGEMEDDEKLRLTIDLAERGLRVAGYEITDSDIVSKNGVPCESTGERDAVAELLVVWADSLLHRCLSAIGSIGQTTSAARVKHYRKIIAEKKSLYSRRRTAYLWAVRLAPKKLAPYFSLKSMVEIDGAEIEGEINEAFEYGLSYHDSSYYSILYGEVLYQVGQYEKATGYFEKAIEQSDNEGKPYIHKTLCQTVKGEVEAAISTLIAGIDVYQYQYINGSGDALIGIAGDLLFDSWLKLRIAAGRLAPVKQENLRVRLNATLFVAFYYLQATVGNCRRGMWHTLYGLMKEMGDKKLCITAIGEEQTRLEREIRAAQAYRDCVIGAAEAGLHAIELDRVEDWIFTKYLRMHG